MKLEKLAKFKRFVLTAYHTIPHKVPILHIHSYQALTLSHIFSHAHTDTHILLHIYSLANSQNLPRTYTDTAASANTDVDGKQALLFVLLT